MTGRRRENRHLGYVELMQLLMNLYQYYATSDVGYPAARPVGGQQLRPRNTPFDRPRGQKIAKKAAFWLTALPVKSTPNQCIAPRSAPSIVDGNFMPVKFPL
jgi:hypothetical protein